MHCADRVLENWPFVIRSCNQFGKDEPKAASFRHYIIDEGSTRRWWRSGNGLCVRRLRRTAELFVDTLAAFREAHDARGTDLSRGTRIRWDGA
jgi:hypothetical protein